MTIINHFSWHWATQLLDPNCFFASLTFYSFNFQMLVAWRRPRPSNSSKKNLSALSKNIARLIIQTSRPDLVDCFWGFRPFELFHRRSSSSSSLFVLSGRLRLKPLFVTCCFPEHLEMPSSGRQLQRRRRCLPCHLQVTLASPQPWPCPTSTHQPLSQPTPCDSKLLFS